MKSPALQVRIKTRRGPVDTEISRCYFGPMFTKILAMVLALPPAYTDADEPDRQVRMTTIAHAVHQATERASCTGQWQEAGCEPIWTGRPEDLAALVVTKGWWESRFARNVHAGQCKPYECDPVSRAGRVVHLARTPWQFQKTGYSAPFWADMVGTDLEPTRNAAWVASIILSRGYSACRSFQGAIVWYGRGRCESASVQLRNRMTTFTKLQNVARNLDSKADAS